MNDPELPETPFSPPDYVPVSFENLEQDKYYLVRMTTHGLFFSDLLLFTGHAVNWKNADRVRPKLDASRKFKRIFSIEKMLETGILIPDEQEEVEADEEGNLPLRVGDVNQHDGEIVTMDQFTEIVNHPRAEEVFNKLPYATGENGVLLPDEWFEHPVPLTYPINKDDIKMEVSDAEYGYVFFKKMDAQEGGRRRRRRSMRRRRSARRTTRRRQRR